MTKVKKILIFYIQLEFQVEERYYQLNRKLSSKDLEIESLQAKVKELEVTSPLISQPHSQTPTPTVPPPPTPEKVPNSLKPIKLAQSEKEDILSPCINNIVKLGREILTNINTSDFHLIACFHKFDKVMPMGVTVNE